jgi:molybdopterin converting factor small subunit
MVTVRLLGQLTSESGEHVLEWELTAPTTLKQLLLDHRQEIPEVIKLWNETECMFTVGVRIAAETTVVKDGDIVKVTPHNSHLHQAVHPPDIGGTV